MRTLAVVLALVAIGNVLIFGAHVWLSHSASAAASEARPEIKNFREVDDRLWRGAAPTRAGYEDLADAGVVTIVDLRAEDGIHVNEERLATLGLTRVHLPMRDGQAPTPEQVRRFLEVVQQSPGRVYVHCGAGVGRTGTLAAAYLVETGQVGGSAAVRRNLAVGPPSLEQVVFSMRLREGDVRATPRGVVAMSRAIDAPRRFLVRVRGSYTRGH